MLAALLSVERPDAEDVYVGGDVNMQIYDPRDADEEEDAECLHRIHALPLLAWGAPPAAVGMPLPRWTLSLFRDRRLGAGT